jgi:hypothetical protein
MIADSSALRLIPRRRGLQHRGSPRATVIVGTQRGTARITARCRPGARTSRHPLRLCRETIVTTDLTQMLVSSGDAPGRTLQDRPGNRTNPRKGLRSKRWLSRGDRTVDAGPHEERPRSPTVRPGSAGSGPSTTRWPTIECKGILEALEAVLDVPAPVPARRFDVSGSIADLVGRPRPTCRRIGLRARLLILLLGIGPEDLIMPGPRPADWP